MSRGHHRLHPRSPRSPMGAPTMVTTTDPVHEAASQLFDQFCAANTYQAITSTFSQICDALDLNPTEHRTFYRSLKSKLTSWKAQSLWAKLDKRMSHREYRKAQACSNTQVLIIGGGPCGLRTAIEVAFLGGKAVVVEKRDRLSRNNVLHLWPFLIHDLKTLGAKKFFGKFCAGAIDHISIRTLQCILLKVALLLGVEIHAGVTYEGLAEPPPPDPASTEKIGWRAKVRPADHPVSEYEFDVLIGADGKRNTVTGFKRKEFRGKLAIAITANFINRNTQQEARVEEISGVAYIFNQKFFKDLYSNTGIDLENIVYYKDETHYFVMTAKKHSLLYKGVLKQDYEDPARLLSRDNVDQEALLGYAREAADVSTNHQLPTLDFAHNHYGQPDVAMFDFTSIFHAEHASRVLERQGHRLLVALVGDSLLEPFWPIGSGCARGFLGCMDAAWMIRSWASGAMNPLEVMAERESIYQLLSQTTPENLNKNFSQYTIDPSTRYPNLNTCFFKATQVRGLYEGTDQGYIDKIVLLSQQNSKKYEYMRDSHYLLKWFQRQLEPYRHIVKVLDLTSTWRNGLALSALIHKYRPELIDLHSLDGNKVSENNQRAFDLSEKEFGIAPVMSGADMAATETPDKLLMVSYLYKFYEYFRKESIRPAKMAKTPDKLDVKGTNGRGKSPSSRLKMLNKMADRIRQRRATSSDSEDDMDDQPPPLGLGLGKENEAGGREGLKRQPPQPSSLSHSTARKRLKEGEALPPSGLPQGGSVGEPSAFLKGYKHLELGETGGDDYMARYERIRKELQQQRMSAMVGVRGQNKVSALAKGLADKFDGKPPPERPQPSQAARPIFQGKATPSDHCFFCKTKVYLVERQSAEGVFFHRGCFRCDYCGINLRLGTHVFKRGEDGAQGKFYCSQHVGLKKASRKHRKRSYMDKHGGAAAAAQQPALVVDSLASLEPSSTPPPPTALGASTTTGTAKTTPERIEFDIESEMEESELEQTAHNLSGSQIEFDPDLDSEDSDEDSSSEDELEGSWSDEDGSDGDVSWADLALSYRTRLKEARRAARREHGGGASGEESSDTATIGASDADYETEDTEGQDSDNDGKKKSGALMPPVPVEPKPSPTSQAIKVSRLSFFSAPAEPVRIDAMGFLGLRPPPPPPPPPEPPKVVEEPPQPEKEEEEVKEEEAKVDVLPEAAAAVEASSTSSSEEESTEKGDAGSAERRERQRKRERRRKQKQVDRVQTAQAITVQEVPVVSIDIISSPSDNEDALVVKAANEAYSDEDGEMAETSFIETPAVKTDTAEVDKVSSLSDMEQAFVVSVDDLIDHDEDIVVADDVQHEDVVDNSDITKDDDGAIVDKGELASDVDRQETSAEAATVDESAVKIEQNDLTSNQTEVVSGSVELGAENVFVETQQDSDQKTDRDAEELSDYVLVEKDIEPEKDTSTDVTSDILSEGDTKSQDTEVQIVEPSALDYSGSANMVSDDVPHRGDQSDKSEESVSLKTDTLASLPSIPYSGDHVTPGAGPAHQLAKASTSSGSSSCFEEKLASAGEASSDDAATAATNTLSDVPSMPLSHAEVAAAVAVGGGSNGSEAEAAQSESTPEEEGVMADRAEKGAAGAMLASQEEDLTTATEEEEEDMTTTAASDAPLSVDLHITETSSGPADSTHQAMQIDSSNGGVTTTTESDEEDEGYEVDSLMRLCAAAVRDSIQRSQSREPAPGRDHTQRGQSGEPENLEGASKEPANQDVTGSDKDAKERSLSPPKESDDLENLTVLADSQKDDSLEAGDLSAMVAHNMPHLAPDDSILGAMETTNTVGKPDQPVLQDRESEDSAKETVQTKQTSEERMDVESDVNLLIASKSEVNEETLDRLDTSEQITELSVDSSQNDDKVVEEEVVAKKCTTEAAEIPLLGTSEIRDIEKKIESESIEAGVVDVDKGTREKSSEKDAESGKDVQGKSSLERDICESEKVSDVCKQKDVIVGACDKDTKERSLSPSKDSDDLDNLTLLADSQKDDSLEAGDLSAMVAHNMPHLAPDDSILVAMETTKTASEPVTEKESSAKAATSSKGREKKVLPKLTTDVKQHSSSPSPLPPATPPSSPMDSINAWRSHGRINRAMADRLLGLEPTSPTPRGSTPASTSGSIPASPLAARFTSESPFTVSAGSSRSSSTTSLTSASPFHKPASPVLSSTPILADEAKPREKTPVASPVSDESTPLKRTESREAPKAEAETDDSKEETLEFVSTQEEIQSRDTTTEVVEKEIEAETTEASYATSVYETPMDTPVKDTSREGDKSRQDSENIKDTVKEVRDKAAEGSGYVEDKKLLPPTSLPVASTTLPQSVATETFSQRLDEAARKVSAVDSEELDAPKDTPASPPIAPMSPRTKSDERAAIQRIDKLLASLDNTPTTTRRTEATSEEEEGKRRQASGGDDLESSIVEVTVSDNEGQRSFRVDEKFITPREKRRRKQKENLEKSHSVVGSPSHSGLGSMPDLGPRSPPLSPDSAGSSSFTISTPSESVDDTDTAPELLSSAHPSAQPSTAGVTPSSTGDSFQAVKPSATSDSLHVGGGLKPATTIEESLRTIESGRGDSSVRHEVTKMGDKNSGLRPNSGRFGESSESSASDSVSVAKRTAENGSNSKVDGDIKLSKTVDSTKDPQPSASDSISVSKSTNDSSALTNVSSLDDSLSIDKLAEMHANETLSLDNLLEENANESDDFTDLTVPYPTKPTTRDNRKALNSGSSSTLDSITSWNLKNQEAQQQHGSKRDIYSQSLPRNFTPSKWHRHQQQQQQQQQQGSGPSKVQAAAKQPKADFTPAAPHVNGIEPMDVIEDESEPKSWHGSEAVRSVTGGNRITKSNDTLDAAATDVISHDARSVMSDQTPPPAPVSSLMSPNRKSLVELNRARFFSEAPQPLRIDPKNVFDDLRWKSRGQRPSPGEITVATAAVETTPPQNGVRRGLDLKQGWDSLVGPPPSKTPTSPTAAIPHSDSVNGETDLFYTPPTSIKPPASDESKLHGGEAVKRRLHPAPGGGVATELTAEQFEAVSSAAADGVGRPDSAKSQLSSVSSASGASSGPPADSRGLQGAAAAAGTSTEEDGASPANGRKAAKIRLPTTTRRDRKSKSKSVEVKPSDEEKENNQNRTESGERKEKRRSFLAMLMPSKSVDRAAKDRNKKSAHAGKTTPTSPPTKGSTSHPLKGATSATSPPPSSSQASGRGGRKQDDQDKPTSRLKFRSKSKERKKKKEEAEEAAQRNARSIYDEMAPMMESLRQKEEAKVTVRQRLEEVAPPPAQYPNTALHPPKAAGEDFDTESEFGDTASLRSFQSGCEDVDSGSVSTARVLRRQQRALRRKQREEEMSRMRMAQEIQRQLEEVQIKQKEVESRGIAIERALRREDVPPDSPVSLYQHDAAKVAGYDEAALMQDWFNVVHEKTVLTRYESELVVHGRELELEDRHARLEQQLRDRLTDGEGLSKEEEQKILSELLEVVEQRDALVKLLEDDRLREQETERELREMMAARGFQLNPITYANRMRLPSLTGGSLHSGLADSAPTSAH